MRIGDPVTVIYQADNGEVMAARGELQVKDATGIEVEQNGPTGKQILFIPMDRIYRAFQPPVA